VLHLVRHGRPLTDAATPARTWPLDPDGYAAIETLRTSGRLPVTATWFSSPERKARDTAARLTDEPVAVVMATMGDLCESVIKRDLGIKDMSSIVPGHGGVMDRLDSLLATVAPTWLLLYYLVPVVS
jgi:hypothetical protein